MKDEELEAIGGYVKTHIAQWLRESRIIPIEAGYQARDYDRDVSLAERTVRVEEGIKHQGEIMEKILHQMDKRVEQVDKRLLSKKYGMTPIFETARMYTKEIPVVPLKNIFGITSYELG